MVSGKSIEVELSQGLLCTADRNAKNMAFIRASSGRAGTESYTEGGSVTYP